jgi:hypothetical protein
MSTTYTGSADLGGPVTRHVERVTLPVGGVLTRTLAQPGCFVLEAGATLRGFIGQYADGATALDPDTSSLTEWLVWSEGSSTVAHLDPGASVAEKITTSTGADVVVGPEAHTLTYRWDSVAAVWVWFFQ